MYSTFDYANAQGGAAADRSRTGERRRPLGAHHILPGARGPGGRRNTKSRSACHPHDPAIPGGKPFRGVHRVMGSVEGLKRFVSIKENPYHGLNFCQGTVSEMLDRPGEQIYDVIRYFGERKKIFNVHFRNIKGRIRKFQETFPDNGDVELSQASGPGKRWAYHWHAHAGTTSLKIDGDEGGRQAFAFAFGDIRALIQQATHKSAGRGLPGQGAPSKSPLGEIIFGDDNTSIRGEEEWYGGTDNDFTRNAAKVVGATAGDLRSHDVQE